MIFVADLIPSPFACLPFATFTSDDGDARVVMEIELGASAYIRVN